MEWCTCGVVVKIPENVAGVLSPWFESGASCEKIGAGSASSDWGVEEGWPIKAGWGSVLV